MKLNGVGVVIMGMSWSSSMSVVIAQQVKPQSYDTILSCARSKSIGENGRCNLYVPGFAECTQFRVVESGLLHSIRDGLNETACTYDLMGQHSQAHMKVNLAASPTASLNSLASPGVLEDQLEDVMLKMNKEESCAQIRIIAHSVGGALATSTLNKKGHSMDTLVHDVVLLTPAISPIAHFFSYPVPRWMQDMVFSLLRSLPNDELFYRHILPFWPFVGVTVSNDLDLQ